ncbi:MAG: TonB-dependent receptor [Gemmatimonadaceae bacterium]|nr:TonB-dependent receptor [Gemmatimonadaceae bacterium]
MRGELRDSSSGAALRGAEVSVTGVMTRRIRTDAAGHFAFSQLPARTVRLRVRLIGFTPLERDIDLGPGNVSLSLRLGASTITLDSVTVVTDARADPLSGVAATSTIDAAELSATRGQTLGETIKFLPGVSVIQFGPSIAKPVIRGLNSQRVLVMNAGLRQEDQQWGTEHAPNIDSFDADRVTVVRGAATVLYGPDAIGGVVRVEHAPVPVAGARTGDLSINGFSNSRQGALSVRAQGPGVRLPGIGVIGYRVRLTSRVAGNGGAPDYSLSNTGFRELNGSATIGIHRGWGNADVMLSHFGTELGVLRQAHAGNFDDLQRAMTTEPRDSAFTYTIGSPNQRVEHTTARVRATFTLPNDGALEVTYGSQANHRREFDNHGPLRFRDIAAFNLKLFTNSIDVRWKHGLQRGFLGTIGSSAMIQGNQTRGKAFLIPGFDLSQAAVFAQEEYAIGRVTLSAGARGDVFSQTTIPYSDAGIRSAAGTTRWTGFSGSFGSDVHLTSSWSASARIARAWRPPTVNERYAQGVHHGTAQYELGRANLTPERSSGIEGTLRYAAAGGSMEVAAYDNRINGFIFLQPGAPVLTLRGAFPGYNYNQTNARLRGVELSGMITPRAWLHLTGTANAVRGTDRVNGGPLYDMPADRATVQARVVGFRPRLGNWYMGVGAVLVRKQDNVPTGTVYALPTQGYVLASADLGSAQLSLAGRRIDLSLSATNVLNARYRDYLSRYRLFVNDAGRDLIVRLRVPF